ncbi:MAG: hypothetical protein KKD74_11800 [Bacteroidetes bacterium]|nr:hypothetical protein [Bacteroidota bacterium]
MKRQIYLFIGMFLLAETVYAFEGAGVIGARSGGLGKASVSLSDFWSLQNNPAGISLHQHIEAGIYFENRFLIKELALKSAGIIVPVKIGVLGLSFNQFGGSLYNENKLGLAYARSFGPMLRIGVQLDYLSTRFGEGYAGAQNITFELGVQSTLNDHITAGAFLFNPLKGKLSELTNERIPITLRFGITYHFNDKFFGIAEIEKQSDLKPALRLGMEYAINARFYARLGTSTQTDQLTFGTGISVGRLTIDISAALHQYLGTSAQAGLIYRFGPADQ